MIASLMQVGASSAGNWDVPMAVMPCAGLLPCMAMAGQSYNGFPMHSILRAEAHSQPNTLGSGVCAGRKAAAESCEGWMG